MPLAVDSALVFVIQFAYVLLLGLQSLNVNGGHRTAAAATSLALGMCGYQITSAIAAHRGEFCSVVWWAYVLAGPCGIVSSMAVFSRYRGARK